MADLVDLVLERCSRDGVPCCEVCGTELRGERGTGWALHHRRFRDGSTDTAANLLVVCGGGNTDGCHGLIHSGKAYAIDRGWAISRHTRRDPALISVLIDRESRWTYLTVDGGYETEVP